MLLQGAGSPEVFDRGELVKLAIDAAGASPTAEPSSAFVDDMAQVADGCCRDSLLRVNIGSMQLHVLGILKQATQGPIWMICGTTSACGSFRNPYAVDLADDLAMHCLSL